MPDFINKDQNIHLRPFSTKSVVLVSPPASTLWILTGRRVSWNIILDRKKFIEISK